MTGASAWLHYVLRSLTAKEMTSVATSFPVNAERSHTQRLRFTLAILFLINFLNFYDRVVVGAVGEVIRKEWGLSDSQLASLTTAFILLYAVIGIPLGRWADIGRRSVILSLGVMVWSAFTIASGLATNFAMLFACRLGVGVGEASAAPAGNSLLGDLFPPEKRARAISIFMLGLPLGLGASFLISGLVTKAVGGWRPALFVAGAPGLIVGLIALSISDPARGRTEGSASAESSRAAIARILSLRPMWWIIASGALFNLNMYALNAFLTSFFIRFHHLDIDHANRFSALVFGVGGGVGMLIGGMIGDRVSHGGASLRLRVAAFALLITSPLSFFALQQPAGAYWPFALLMVGASAVMYVYYSTVYSAIQDIVPPTLRGMAMAVYFFVFYVFTAVGLVVFGRLSDGFAKAARAAGADDALARATGLHQALYAVPVISLVLVGILWAASSSATSARSA